MDGAFFMPGGIWAFLCLFLRKEVSAVVNRIMGITGYRRKIKLLYSKLHVMMLRFWFWLS